MASYSQGNGSPNGRNGSAVANGTDRLPPQNLEAERGVLGSALLDNDVLHDVVPILKVEDFYRDTHQILYRTIRDLYDDAKAVDAITLAEELTRRGEYAKIGGDEALAEILGAVPHAANARYYAQIVRQKAVQRELIQAANEILREGYSNTRTSDELLELSERLVFQIAEDTAAGDTAEISEVLAGAMEQISLRAEEKHPLTGISTGYFDLDDMTAGFQPNQLIILAARPSIGKTALALNMCEHVALERKVSVLFVSLEMGELELGERLLCARARIDSNKIRTGRGLGTRELADLGSAYMQLRESPIFIDDTPARNMLQIAANARRLKMRKDLGLIVVDYIQLIDAEQSSDSRQEQIAKISRRLKTLARELKIPVIALSQLNREVERREDRRPRMADLRECVTGDTLVLLADGRRVPVRQLVGTEPEVLAMSGDGRIVTARSDRVWCVGSKPVFEIRLASGRCLRATGRHRLYGAPGWVRVADLQPGDRVATARTLPEPDQPTSWSESRLVLLGHLIGDGSYLKHQPLRYTTGSEDNSNIVTEAAQGEFSVTIHRHPGRGNWHQLVFSGNGNRWRPTGLNQWLRELGIFNQRSHEKRIPTEVFRLPNAQIAVLLRHLWATDGCIAPRRPGTRGSAAIFFATASEGLARDVVALLLRLGVMSRLRAVTGKRLLKSMYTVGISGATNQLRFLDQVGGFGPRREPAERLRDLLRTTRANTNVDTLPQEVFERVRRSMRAAGISIRTMAALRGTSCGGMAHFRFAPSRETVASYAELLDDDDLRREARTDLFWDRIVSIQPAGEEEVFDLTVPGPASWLADGIISHNSGAIEQDADIVLLLHRPDYYDPNDQPGIAELIVAKNRSGATGAVKLKFFKNYTRFENLSEIVEPLDGAF